MSGKVHPAANGGNTQADHYLVVAYFYLQGTWYPQPATVDHITRIGQDWSWTVRADGRPFSQVAVLLFHRDNEAIRQEIKEKGALDDGELDAIRKREDVLGSISTRIPP